MPIIGSIIKGTIELRGKSPFDKKKRGRFNAVLAQQKVLKKLMRKAQSTHFGEFYGFSELLQNDNVQEAFLSKVPVHDYEKIYQKWWYRSLNGEPFVAWPGKTGNFALSSGTSSASSKHIPVTSEMLKAIKKTGIRQVWSLAHYNFPRQFFEKGILMLGGSTHLNNNGSYFEGDLSGINLDKLPFWFQHFYKPGKRIAKERDWQVKLEEIVSKAKDWDIGVIVGVPAWHHILLEKIIDRYQLNNIHELWPNLQVFVHGGVSFGPYVKSFEKLLGKPITYMETYLASEGFIAYQSRPDSRGMELVLDNGIFYEFVPYTDDNFDSDGNIIDSPQTLTIGDVEEGVSYALLITTCAGAWRYLIGDIIKFTDLPRHEIVITGRTKLFLSLCGEHLSQENMNRAVELVEEELNVDIREFSVAGIEHNGLFAHQWYFGTDDKLDATEAVRCLDKHLKELNDDYRVERTAAVKDVYLEILPSHVFYDYMRNKGKEGSQNKFPRVLKNHTYDEWAQHVQQYKEGVE